MQLSEMQSRMMHALMRPLNETLQDSEYSYIVSTPSLRAEQRIRIYRESYWHRLLHALSEDFVGLGAILGSASFRKLLQAYLQGNPSLSFSLRNLGQFMEEWLRANPTFAGDEVQMCLDMVRLEWATIETFDEAQLEPLSIEELAAAGADSRFALQPHIRLLSLCSPVDDIHLAAKDAEPDQLQAALAAARDYQGPPIEMAIHRNNGAVYFRALGEAEMRMLQGLKQGATLEDAIGQGFRGSTLTVEEQAKLITECFGSWAKQGWLVHARDNSTKS